MRWFHHVQGHRIRFAEQMPVVLWDGSTIPVRRIYRCSCGRVWVRRLRKRLVK